MIGFLLISALLISVNCQNASDVFNINPPNCGRRISEIRSLQTTTRFFSNKIVGGSPADPEDWGWQVAINTYGRFGCSAILINSQWILSAAHCFSTTATAPYSVLIGVHDRSNLEPWVQTRRLIRIINHPQYSQSGFRNDISLAKLETPIRYNDQIVPHCIPDASEPLVGRTGFAHGWGNSVIGSSFYPARIQQVEIPIMSDSYCTSVYSGYDRTIALCAGENGGNRGPCQGDSGSALSVRGNSGRWYAAGITSWTYNCNNGAVYTRVSTYRQWILQIINAN